MRGLLFEEQRQFPVVQIASFVTSALRSSSFDLLLWPWPFVQIAHACPLSV